MLAPRLFWKLFLIYTALQLATVISFVMLVSNWQERQAVLMQGQRLHDAVMILRDQMHQDFAEGTTAQRQTTVARLAAETQMRVTLVAMDGTVLADSEKDPERMENQAKRPELVGAARQGVGSKQRFSTTLQLPMFYYAARVDDSQERPLGLVRLAVPLTQVQAEVSAVERTLWLVAVGVSLGGMALTYIVVGRALAPVATLTRAANAMAAGRYQQRVRVPSQDELGNLAQSFNRMVNEIETREVRLREIVDRMAAVLGGMIEGVIAVDDQQQILFANQAAGNLLGFIPNKVQGRQLIEAVRNHLLQQLVTDSLQRSTSKRNDLKQVEINASAAGNVVLAINAARLPGEPCPGIVLVLHDVTELRRLETLRHEFVANVSHELKTPLSAIMAYAETLRHGALRDPENSVRFVGQIQDQAGRLSELIQDMLQLARVESGHVAYEITSLPIGAVVDKCLADHEKTAQARGVQLTAQRELWGLEVRADEEALRQILDNLVNNAIKYTAEKGHVSIAWKAEAGDVVVEVQDDGIGIAQQHQSRIFERFYRVDRARSRELGGTGLGLSIVKHLTQALSGTVSLDSSPGCGSTFQVRLPGAEKGSGAEKQIKR